MMTPKAAMSAITSPSRPALHPLHEQQRFQALLLKGDAHEAPDDGEAPLLQPGCARGLQVYQQAYRARLVGALQENFPVLLQAMGDASFEALALAYLDAHPSRQPSIRWFGHGLADFMAGPYAEALDHPALVDVARMDWALRAAFDAADDEPLSPAGLAAAAAEEGEALRLRPRASSQLLQLDWAVEPAWAELARHRQAVEAAAESGRPVEADEPELPEPLAHPHALLIWRPGLDTRWRSLEAAEAQLVRAVFEGARLDGLSQCAAEAWGPDEAAGALATWVQQSLQEGWLRG